jgi:alpha-L-fucosidase
MFVHWGLYAQLGRNEWVWAIESIPKKEYEKLAETFKPKPRPMREWCRLAKQAGMKYMVMTTKHHEGYCLWDTKQTDFNSVKTGPRRDLVKEYVEACREFGLKIGFYYSLMDWHHPDGAACAHDEKARRRFIDFTHGCVRELMTNYGKIDILWYDVSAPLKSPEKWESVKMNTMARQLQPHIIINNRSQLPEDFSTPEGSVRPAETGRGWEACMTFNHASWGYMPSAAIDAHTPRDILNMLHTCAAGQGNLLMNIGPAPDGSVPEDAVAPLQTVGKWLAINGKVVYGKTDRCSVGMATVCGYFSQTGNIAYFWCKFWPGREIPLGGFKTKLRKASFLATGKPIKFTQNGARIILKGLPPTSPDKLAGVTVIKLEFASKPRQTFAATNEVLHAWD